MFYKWLDQELHLFVKVQPKACKDEFTEILDGRIKIRITAPPVDGKANKHLIKYLSEIFSVPKNRILIKSGRNGCNKHLVIQEPKQLPEEIDWN